MERTKTKIVCRKKGAKLIKEKKAVIIVIDLLRASSTIINGLENGPKIYIPSLTIKEAWKLLKKNPDAFLIDDRRGIKIPRFQLGNSPLEHKS